MRRATHCLVFLFLSFGLFAADKKNATNSNPSEENFKGYDLMKFDSMGSPDLLLARISGLPTISVLSPKDFSGLSNDIARASLPPMYSNRFFLFPSGFGTDYGFLSASPRQSGGYARRGETLDQVLAPMGIGYSNYTGVYSPLFGMLQQELTMALGKSKRFRPMVPINGPMSEDWVGIEREKKVGAQKTNNPLDREPTADFFLGSSIGVKGVQVTKSSFRGDNEITDFVASIFNNSNSYDRNRRVDQAVNIFRGYSRYQEETIATVVVNLYISGGRTIMAGGSGIGVTKVNTTKVTSGAGMTTGASRDEFLLIEAVRKAVQNAFENMSSVK